MKRVTRDIDHCENCPFRDPYEPYCEHDNAWDPELKTQGPRVIHTDDEVDSFPAWCPLPDTPEVVTEMALCETMHVVLHPDQLYRFKAYPYCTRCQELARLSPKGKP